MTTKEGGKKLHISARGVRNLIRWGYLKAVKVKGKFQIDDKYFSQRLAANKKCVSKLKEEYLTLYRQGLNPEQIQRRVSDDFAKNRIFCVDSRSFAELTIYESLPKMKTARRNGKEEHNG